MDARAANFEQLKDDDRQALSGRCRASCSASRASRSTTRRTSRSTPSRRPRPRSRVQPSAMVRFAQALGYSGYTDMQQIFRDRLVERSSSYRERIEGLRRGKRPRATSGRPRVLREFVADSIANLAHLEEHVDAALLEKAVRLLASAERIHVLAQRRAFPVACYLSYALSQLELPGDAAGWRGRHAARAGARHRAARRPGRRELPQLFAGSHRAGCGLPPPRRAGGGDHRQPDEPAARRARASPSTSATTATGRSARWWSRCASRWPSS